MITSIKLKNIATYDEKGVELADLRKINFIYGGNGSGKTTISNFLKNCNDTKYSECEIEWKNGISISTLVYNKKFKDENFKEQIKGVFTLGEATNQQKEEIKNKEEELKNIKDERQKRIDSLNKLNEEKQTIEGDFENRCWIKLKKEYEGDFYEAFKGALYKHTFKEKLLTQSNTNEGILFSYEELNTRAKTIFGETPQTIPLLENIEYQSILEIEQNVIWSKKIIGKEDIEISKIIQRLNISDWVHQGKFYIEENSEVCPFCQQQTITQNFKNQLESFFDETYTNDLNLIKNLANDYHRLTSNITNTLGQIEENQKNFKESKLDIDKFSSYLKTLQSQIIANLEKINAKIKEPSREVVIQSLENQFVLISKLIQDTNTKIQKHNNIVNNFTFERNKLVSDIWRFLVEEFKTEITNYKTAIQNKNNAINGISNFLLENTKKQDRLKDEIKNLNKNITSVQPTIDEINRLLRKFGFLTFEIVKAQEEGNYQIKRENGEIANETLSEGEITFITFLYYLQLAKGGETAEKISEERILVIDDPISSLDSNVLFVVSTLLKGIIDDIKNNRGNISQLILLTHNIYFHKEISFIDKGKTDKEENKPHYWILRKNNKISYVEAYNDINPIKSSYQLLWEDIKNDEINSISTIQNTMRRILENYFGLFGNYNDENIIQKFENLEEQMICRSLYSWINDGSHCLNDDFELELPNQTIEIYKKVFEQIFNKMGHISHYNMMMGIE